MGLLISNLMRKNNKKDITEIIENLIHTLFKVAPFYAEIMLRLKFVENEKVAIAGTDGMTIYYNSKALNKLSEGECNYIILHEMLHVILLHCIRDAGRDPKVWNIAADCVANCFVDNIAKRLRTCGVPCKRPSMGCFLENADRYSVEEVYDFIMSKRETEDCVKVLFMQFNGDQEDLGSCLSQEEQECIKNYVEQILAAAMPWGENGYHDIERLFNIMAVKKRLPWRQLLKKMWVKNENEESSYLTPERKYLHMELIVSGWGMHESEKLPHIWAFVDSSGSIGDEALGVFLAQLFIISKELGTVLNIAYWHTTVTDVYTNIEDSKDIVKCIPRHSGGTDANCIYEYLKANKIKPDVMIILTDGRFDSVPDSVVGNLKKKTIVVLEGDGMGAHHNLGKEARL